MPLGVLAATVKFPSTSTLIGPCVSGVTSVLAVVTAFVFKVSFPKTFPAGVGELLVATIVAGSSTASIKLSTTTVATAVSQFAGTAPVSHNSYVMV